MIQTAPTGSAAGQRRIASKQQVLPNAALICLILSCKQALKWHAGHAAHPDCAYVAANIYEASFAT